MEPVISDVIPARFQFACTAIFHTIWPILTVGTIELIQEQVERFTEAA
jgi:cytochrome bd-type quinol oxidase subunit 1